MTTPSKNHSSPRPKVLLIGWDGADWEHITPMLERGLLPTLEKFINHGVMGNLSTMQPVLSPILWNSVATCKHADKHGILGFIERDLDNGGARPFSSTSRKSKALWNILSQSGFRSNVINWWASHPAEKINGCVVSNLFSGVRFDSDGGWQISDGTIHPEHLLNDFAKFKVFPEELTEEHILPFIPNAANIDQTQDKRLSGFAKTLADTATTQAIATAVMATQPWDFMAIYYTGIDHFGHGFMPYFPPRMPYIKEEDFEMYKDVMDGAYRFHDMMLESLLSQCDDNTTVILCSDHGFHSRESRPLGVPREPAGPAIWHRKYGIFLAKGPGIKQDERIYGASLIDVGPTILSLFDLPIGEDMDGRPLLEIFEQPRSLATIPSWETVSGEDGVLREHAPISKAESKELLKQFAALGYIDDPGENQEKQAISADTEARYNLARSLLWQGKNEASLELMQALAEQFPWETRFVVQLAECNLKCGYLLQAQRVIESAFDLSTTTLSQLLLLYAKIQWQLGQSDAALKNLQEAERRMPRASEVYCDIGDAFVGLRQWSDAQRNFEKAIQLNSGNALAWQNLAAVHLRLGNNQEAADAALEAVGLLHRLPKAHLTLALVMLRSGDQERALMALQTAVKFAPKMINAHRWLTYLYDQTPAGRDLADHHRMQVQRLLSAESIDRQELRERTTVTFPLPDFGDEKSRELRLRKERPYPHEKSKPSGKTFVVVSGLPRSGTSLMMQMLVQGGLPAISDGQRVSDVDNPKGYFEWEAVKRIAEQPELLDDPAIEGRVFKAVSVLLKDLPLNHHYKIVFMARPLPEVILSQEKMIDRLGTERPAMDTHQVLRSLKNHLKETFNWMNAQSNVEFLVIDYPALVQDPASVVPLLQEFLGERLPTPQHMAVAVDPQLYRHRTTGDH